MFRIEFEGADGKKAIPWQNSWGLTTRTLGVMVMARALKIGYTHTDTHSHTTRAW